MKTQLTPDYGYYTLVTKIKLQMARKAGMKELAKEVLELHKRKCKLLHDNCKRFYIGR